MGLTATTRQQPVSLWRNRDYMLLWCGQVVSSVGTGISSIPFTLLALALTHSPAQVGFIGALSAVPYLVFSLPAGALIDRWDRKRVMIICDTGRALLTGSIPIALWVGHLTVLQLSIVAMGSGAFFVFFNIAEAACLPRVVPKEQLPAATAQNQATDGVATLIGPPLGGAIYQSLGPIITFLADAISYAASVVSLFFITTEFQGARNAAPRKLRVEIMEGLSWLWNQPLIRFMAFLTGTANLVFSGLGLIVIVLAGSQHAPPAAIGVIFSIGAIGGILGSMIGGRIQKRFSFGQVIIGVVWVQALLWPLFAVAPNVVALGLVSGALFLLSPIYNVVQFSYRSALIPDELQGRVNSAFRLIAFGGQPVGQALAGVSLQTVGVTRTVLLFGVFLVLMAVAATLNAGVRHARPIGEAQQA